MEDKRRIPKYKLIENDLIDKINSGVYTAGSMLPTEVKLADMYGCSRVTVRQALSELAFRNFIVKMQGSGTMVSESRAVQRTPLLKSFTEDMQECGKTVHSDVRVFEIVKASETMSKILGISEGDSIYYIERCRYADDLPMVYEKTYMSVELHPDISVSILRGSKYKYGEDRGMCIELAHQNIAPIFPPENIAQQLNISTDQPCLRIANTTYCTDGQVFDYTELYLNPELYQLNIIKHR